MELSLIREAQRVFGQKTVCAATARPCDLGPAYYEQSELEVAAPGMSELCQVLDLVDGNE